jgi:hypothetical protein
MENRTWLLAGIVLAAGVGLTRLLVPGHPKISKGRSRVFLLGDSLAVGLATPLRKLAQDSQCAFEAMAVGGTTVHQWANSEKLKAALEKFKPTLVLVSLGTNDAYSPKLAPEALVADTEKLIKTLMDAGAEVVWIGPPSLPATYSSPNYHATLRPELLEALAKVPKYWIDSRPLQLPRFDALHPTVVGYGGWSGVIWQTVS